MCVYNTHTHTHTCVCMCMCKDLGLDVTENIRYKRLIKKKVCVSVCVYIHMYDVCVYIHIYEVCIYI